MWTVDRDLDHWHRSFSFYNFCADILEALAPYRSSYCIYFIDRNNCSDGSIEIAIDFFAFIESYPLSEKSLSRLNPKIVSTVHTVSIPSRGKAFPDSHYWRGWGQDSKLFPSPLGEKPFQTYVLANYNVHTLRFHPLSGKSLSRQVKMSSGLAKLSDVSIPSRGKAFPDGLVVGDFHSHFLVSIPSRGKAFPDVI
jgi:hypothetical protein